MIIEVRLPAMGEGITDARLSRWLVKTGDFVNKDNPLVEISTDKVDSEIVSPSDGYVNRLFFNEDDYPKVGDLLVVLTTEKDESIVNLIPDNKSKIGDNKNSTLVSEVKKEHIPDHLKSFTFISPFIRLMAQQENIPMHELESIQGTGNDKRITKEDLLSYLDSRIPKKQNEENPDKFIARPKVSNDSDPMSRYSGIEDVDVQELSRMRKMIAANMVKSKQQSPHVSSFVEVNVTRMVAWRNKNKKRFGELYHENLTFLPLFLEAVIHSLKNFPSINASLEGDFLILKKNINLGIATALPDGNLIVPVIQKADMLDLPGLTRQLNDLTTRAKASALSPSEIQGGTFTITNVGSVGNMGGTPIIRQPELAILAIGSINKKPVVVQTENHYGIAIADVVELWLSYDHRIIDGAMGGAFLKQIADNLEDFNESRIV